ncbi:MAG: hypothetical protein QM739_09080 [Propionivibrio sp.]
MKTTPRFWLATLFALLPLSALAGWNEVSSFDDGMRVYVNAATIERAEDFAVVSHLVRWGEPQKSDEDAVYLSTIVRTRYDCAQKLEKYLGSTSYAGPMGNGDVVISDEDEADKWYTISEGSMEEELWAVACRSE